MNPRAFPLLALLVITAGYTSLHRPLQAEKTPLTHQHATLTAQSRTEQQANIKLITEL